MGLVDLQGTSQSSFGWKSTACFILIAVLILAVYIYGQTNPDFLHVFSNVFSSLMALAAAAIGVLAVARTGVDIRDRWSMVWLGFTAGVILWLVGTIYSLVMNVSIQFPSPADALWVAGYVPFILALLFQIWPFREAFSSWKLRSATLSTSVIGIVVLAILIPPSMRAEHDFLSVVVSLTYPLLDVVLLIVAIPSLIFFLDGIFWRPMLTVVCGIILTLLGDIAFDLTVLQGTYYDGHPLDLFFYWSYLAFSLGFYLQATRKNEM